VAALRSTAEGYGGAAGRSSVAPGSPHLRAARLAPFQRPHPQAKGDTVVKQAAFIRTHRITEAEKSG
jgi:hypothetical protein